MIKNLTSENLVYTTVNSENNTLTNAFVDFYKLCITKMFTNLRWCYKINLTQLNLIIGSNLGKLFNKGAGHRPGYQFICLPVKQGCRSGCYGRNGSVFKKKVGFHKNEVKKDL